MTKWLHETELQGPYLYLFYRRKILCMRIILVFQKIFHPIFQIKGLKFGWWFIIFAQCFSSCLDKTWFRGILKYVSRLDDLFFILWFLVFNKWHVFFICLFQVSMMLWWSIVGKTEKRVCIWNTNYGHTMANSLILYGSNSNPNPNK